MGHFINASNAIPSTNICSSCIPHKLHPFPCAIYLPLTPSLIHSIRPPTPFAFRFFPAAPSALLAFSFRTFNFSTKSFRIVSSPSFLLVNNMTSSVLMVRRPACEAKDSRSCAAFPTENNRVSSARAISDAKRGDGKDASKHKYPNKEIFRPYNHHNRDLLTS
jgi:hypothetical protein